MNFFVKLVESWRPEVRQPWAFLLAAGVLALLAAAQNVRAEPLFEVENFVFCADVIDREPVHIYQNPALIQPSDPVCLWMKIRCGANAFRMLNYYKKFPICHAWGLNGLIIDRIDDIGITEDDFFSQKSSITSGFNQDGYFTWRTFSRKHFHHPGQWYVSILDANDSAVSLIRGWLALRPDLLINYQP